MWHYPQETADLVTFTEEILNGKLHFLCNVSYHVVLSILILKDLLKTWKSTIQEQNIIFSAKKITLIEDLINLCEEQLCKLVINKSNKQL